MAADQPSARRSVLGVHCSLFSAVSFSLRCARGRRCRLGRPATIRPAALTLQKRGSRLCNVVHRSSPLALGCRVGQRQHLRRRRAPAGSARSNTIPSAAARAAGSRRDRAPIAPSIHFLLFAVVRGRPSEQTWPGRATTDRPTDRRRNGRGGRLLGAPGRGRSEDPPASGGVRGAGRRASGPNRPRGARESQGGSRRAAARAARSALERCPGRAVPRAASRLFVPSPVPGPAEGRVGAAGADPGRARTARPSAPAR